MIPFNSLRSCNRDTTISPLSLLALSWQRKAETITSLCQQSQSIFYGPWVKSILWEGGGSSNLKKGLQLCCTEDLRVIRTLDSGCLCLTRPVTAQKHQICVPGSIPIGCSRFPVGSPNKLGPSYALPAALCCKESYTNGAAGWQVMAYSPYLHPKCRQSSGTSLTSQLPFAGKQEAPSLPRERAVGIAATKYPAFLFSCNGTNRKEGPETDEGNRVTAGVRPGSAAQQTAVLLQKLNIIDGETKSGCLSETT